jgi:hypothetical protein
VRILPVLPFVVFIAVGDLNSHRVFDRAVRDEIGTMDSRFVDAGVVHGELDQFLYLAGNVSPFSEADVSRLGLVVATLAVRRDRDYVFALFHRAMR